MTTDSSCTHGVKRWCRLPFSATCGLLFATISLQISPAHAAGNEEMAITRVVGIDGDDIIIGAGERAGLAVASDVTLLREGEPIIHPITGQVLGIPQEPVAVVHVYEVAESRSRARLVKMYSDPMVDDFAEYARAPKVKREETILVPEVFEARVKHLESEFEEFGETHAQLRKYPAFARRVWDEISTMKSYLVSIDERLVGLEEPQNGDHHHLSMALSGEYSPADLKEFTIRYTPDTQVKLQAAGKTLLISVVQDSIRMEPTMEMHSDVLAMGVGVGEEEEEGFWGRLFSSDGIDDEEEVEEEPMPMSADDGMERMDEEEPWYMRNWQAIGAVGLILALILMAWLVLRRYYSDVTEDLEEFEDEYLDDDDEEDDDDEGRRRGVLITMATILRRSLTALAALFALMTRRMMTKRRRGEEEEY